MVRTRGFGDITPLNIPSGAATSYLPPKGYAMGTDGNWHWVGSNTPPVIPVASGPGIPTNRGWVNLSGNWYWTGPGTRPNVVPGSMTPPGTIPWNPPQAAGQVHDWAPQPLLPNSMLPAPINRTNPLAAPLQWTRNKYDFEVLTRAKKWQWVAAHGGLKNCCRIPELGAPIYDKPPWQVMPSNSFEFQPMASLPITAFQTAGVFNGLNTQILEIQVPSGYDGVINKFVTVTTDVNGFTDFSGSIVWRLQYGVRFAKNLGNVTNTFGSLTNSLLVPGVNIIRVISGQTIRVFANIPPGSPVSGGTVGAGIFGWFYPRR